MDARTISRLRWRAAVVPSATMGGTTSFKGCILGLPKVAKQLEVSRFPDPIIRQPRADKRVNHVSGHNHEKISELQHALIEEAFLIMFQS